MTKTDVIDYIDSIKPNVYTTEQKSGWIDLLEEKLRTEILSHFEDAEKKPEEECDMVIDDYSYYNIGAEDMLSLWSVPEGAKGRIKIPEKVNETTVYAIERDAFEGHTDITGIIIPPSVISIESSPEDAVIYGEAGSPAEAYANTNEIPFVEVGYIYRLLASGPYEDMYYRWVEAQIDYANNETARYNNAMALFNDAFYKFRNEFNRTHRHKTASLSVL